MGVLEQGIRKGQFREVDPRTAALSIIGMCLWTAWWVEDTPLGQVTEQIADQAVSSVLVAEGDTDLDDPRRCCERRGRTSTGCSARSKTERTRNAAAGPEAASGLGALAGLRQATM